MNSERFWVSILVAVTFLTGLASGVLVGPRVMPPVDPGPFASYQTRLAEEFDLSSEQRARLRWLMGDYAQRLKAVEARFLNETAAERARIGRACRDTIREHILEGEDRDRFQAMAEGVASANGENDRG